MNVHFHVLALDGVYVRDSASGELAFHALPAPTRAEVAEVARRTAERIGRLLVKSGRTVDRALGAPLGLDNDAPEPPELDEPALAACYDAAARGVGLTGEHAGQPTLRLLVPHDPPEPSDTADDEPVAEVRGVNVHAKQWVDGRDRAEWSSIA